MAEEQYRSRREGEIAGMLRRYSLSFKHEHPLAVKDRGRVRIWYPDILLPEQGVLVEYCGLNGNSDYDAGIEHKKQVYSELGLPALFLAEGDLKGFWPDKLLEWLEAVQIRRLQKVRATRKRSGKDS